MTIRAIPRALAGALLSGAALAAPADTTRASCDTHDEADVSLYARYLDGPRTTFDVVLKVPAAASEGLVERTWNVFVAGTRVADVRLTQRSNGSWTGNLSLDSYAGTGAADAGAAPFPPDWPGVTAGTPVRVGRIGCTLQG